jgi:transposase-like protein
VLWRLRYKLSLRDLSEMFLIRGIVFGHEAVRDWEAQAYPDAGRDCEATTGSIPIVAQVDDLVGSNL